MSLNDTYCMQIRNVPAKADTESKRRESRKDARKKAGEFLRAGKTMEARAQFNRCVDITHEMALELIKECRRRNVDCVVGPYVRFNIELTVNNQL